ncbi:MAG: lactate racemase domain-containing protein [Candidatus Latescibacteria bacterium]|nr:lactate racemase domain-containing protein [Candidatus Latescibacterota bacterium]
MPTYPQMFRVRQHFDAPRIDDVADAVRSEISKLNPSAMIKPDQTVAITAGSRGVANIDTIIKTVVEEMQAIGAKPYIVPAMGSHGGGTAEGQTGVLSGYGITEETMGCPIKSSMEVIQIGVSDFGMPIYFDKNASEADHIVVVNRVKPHTGFAGEIESGLMKMMLIGLGKHKGASVYHRAIIHHSFDKIVRLVGKVVREEMPITFGVATLENPYDETALIEAIPASEFEAREKVLQAQSKEWCPSIPFEDVDLLIIDEMGKDISGAGMDTNTIGRKRNDRRAMDDETPRVLRIFVRDLTEVTHGNATGIGMAEFTTQRLVDKIDYHATYTNVITGQHVSAGAVPLHYETDAEVLAIAFESIGLIEPKNARVVWIPNTLDVGEIEASEAYLSQVEIRDDLEIISDVRPLEVEADGNLPPFEAYRDRVPAQEPVPGDDD